MIIYHRHKSRGHKSTPAQTQMYASAVLSSVQEFTQWHIRMQELSGVASVGLRSGSVMANMCLKCSSMIPSGKQKSTDGINMVAHDTQVVS